MSSASTLPVLHDTRSLRLVRTTRLAGDLPTVFAFFKDPRNIETITPPWLGFRIVSASDEVVRNGTRIRYRWYHRHSFRAVDGGVEMTDDVEYRLPFGLLGRLVHLLVVQHQLRAIFDYRSTIIAEQFGSAGSPV